MGKMIYRVGDLVTVKTKNGKSPLHFFDEGQIIRIESIKVYRNGYVVFTCVGDYDCISQEIRQELTLDEFE